MYALAGERERERGCWHPTRSIYLRNYLNNQLTSTCRIERFADLVSATWMTKIYSSIIKKHNKRRCVILSHISKLCRSINKLTYTHLFIMTTQSNYTLNLSASFVPFFQWSVAVIIVSACKNESLLISFDLVTRAQLAPRRLDPRLVKSKPSYNLLQLNNSFVRHWPVWPRHLHSTNNC